MNRKVITTPLAATMAAAFMLASQPAQAQTPQQTAVQAYTNAYPDYVTMRLPSGPVKVYSNKLGPNRKLTIEFLLQMHPENDGYTTYMRRQKNDDLKTAAALIHHLTAHGVEKREIERVMRACGVSNVQYSTPANDK